jgi:hypothetical protein
MRMSHLFSKFVSNNNENIIKTTGGLHGSEPYIIFGDVNIVKIFETWIYNI